MRLRTRIVFSSLRQQTAARWWYKVGFCLLSVCLIAAAKFDSLSEASAALRDYATHVRLAAATTGPDTAVVFGPKQFVTTTNNVQVNFVESVPAYYQLLSIDTVLMELAWHPHTTIFTIHLQRVGGSLTTATVVVNGTQVATAADFASATYIERDVSLSDVFNPTRQTVPLTLTLKGAAGAGLIATIVGTPYSDFNIFGPKTYTKTSTTPTHFVESFSSTGASAPFVMTATANVAGTKAAITLNGVQVIKAVDFGTNVVKVTKTVSLISGSNAMLLDVTGTTGKTITVTITALDKTPPILTIAAPAPNLVTSGASVTVSGTSQDRDTTQVQVNGIIATMSGPQRTQYSVSVPLVPGANSLTIRAMDKSGNHTDSTRTVTRDNLAPSLTVTNPVDGSFTSQTAATVSGTVTDAGTATVKVNGVSVTVGAGGAFTTTVQLAQGANFMTVVATDQAGNTATVTNKVTRDTQPPTLTVTAPSNNLATKQTSVTVTGTVSDASATTVTVNGVNAPVTTGSFSATAALAAEGSNTISVIAKDAALNQTTVSRNVIRDTQAPVATIVSPADGFLTNAASVAVSGTIIDATPNMITANGVHLGPAMIPDGSFVFQGTVPLPVEGANILTFTMTDSPGNTATKSITVRRDTQSPALTVTAPTENFVTKTNVVAITGNVLDASSVAVNANGAPVVVDGTGGLSGSVTLVEGANTLDIVATDGAGNTSTQVRHVTLDTQAPVTTIIGPADGISVTSETIVVSGTVADATGVTVTVNGNPVSVSAGAFSTSVPLSVGANTITIVTTDGAANASTATRTVTFGGAVEDVPPDPVTVAPTVDATVPTTTFAGTAFLYTGPNPIQTGVAPETIQPLQAAELRGIVSTRTGAPLPGVKVTVLGHPEFGQTLSRADGAFDLVVNGGSLLTVSYQKAGFLPAHRQAVVPWRDYVRVDSVTLINLDAASTVVDFSQPVQSAQGSSVTDESGTRRATMFFKGGTHASLVMPNGTIQSIPSVTVRATEYTVGPTGPSSMPAVLPPASGYTYAVELSADEAITAGAAEVRFDSPIAVYVDNFLNFPTGIKVPVGYYDRAKAAWIGSPDGRIVKILEIVNGQAVLDVDGSGSAATPTALAALGIDAPELAKLAGLYPAEMSFWRFQVTHFSVWDTNWPVGLTSDAREPRLKDPRLKRPPYGDCRTGGSIIGCERQTLGERLAVAGTSLSLNYQSDDGPGYIEGYAIDIPLGESLPSTLARIDLTVTIAGQATRQSFAPVANQTSRFVWNGKDVFGRIVQGVQNAHILVGYVYRPSYLSASEWGAISFAGWGVGPISGNQARNEIVMSKAMDIMVGSRGAPGSIGGWTLDVYHSYDPAGKVLYLGNGQKRNGGEIPMVATLLTSLGCEGGDTSHCLAPVAGARAVDVQLSPAGMTIASDGLVYLNDSDSNRIWRINSVGKLELVAGNGTVQFNGDSIPATSAGMSPFKLHAGPDNSIYFSDFTDDGRIRRIDKNGIITTVAGTGICGDSVITGIPATQVNLCGVSFAVGRDGTLYILDNNQVYRVGADGILIRAVGDGVLVDGGVETCETVPSYTCAEGKPASAHAVFSWLTGIAVGPDGSLYLANAEASFVGGVIIYRIGADGIIKRIAGNGRRTSTYRSLDNFGYGRPAVDAEINGVFGVTNVEMAVGPDGTLYFHTEDGHVNHIDQAGVLRHIAGCTAYDTPDCYFDRQDRAITTQLGGSGGVQFGQDGRLYVLAGAPRRIDNPIPAVGIDNMVIASATGSELYEFNADGKHLRTLDALLGHVKYQFGYDAAGLLSTIADADSNVVRVERNGAGVPTGVIAPFGQRTDLTLDSGNHLVALARPGEPATLLGYTPSGLLKTFTDGNGNIHRFTYDSDGLLIRDDNAAGGFTTLTRTVTDSSSSVTVTTASGRSTTHGTTRSGDGQIVRTSIDAGGLSTTALTGGSGAVGLTAPDGTSTFVSTGPDPRLGFQVPINQIVHTITPGGVESDIEHSRTVFLQDPHDPQTFAGQVDSTFVNRESNPGAACSPQMTRCVYTTTFTKSDRSIVSRTPEGRTSAAYFDARGHLVRTVSSGQAAATYSYDSRGRLTLASKAGRDVRYTYDALGRLSKVAAPLGDSVSYTYDAAGRLTQARYADGRNTTFSYDNNGNLTSAVPPERSAHNFTFTPADLNDAYLPPSIGGDSGVVTYTYDTDQRLSVANRSDGTATTFSYDAAGRLASVLMPGGARSIGYDPVGRVSTLTNSSNASVLSFTYDGMLPLTATWTGQVQGSIAVTYDAQARIGIVAINGADPIEHRYDGDGLLTSIGALSVTRNPQTRFPTSATVGGVVRTWDVDSLGAVSAIGAQFGGNQLFAAGYAPDSLGRISQLSETVQGIARTMGYTYNSVGNLTEVRQGGALVASYDYDGNGNRIHETGPNGTINSTYDAQDRLLSHGSSSYAYTANGEVRLKIIGTDTTKFQYDAAGPLLKVVLPSGTSIEYVLDPIGRRVGRKLNGVLMQGFLYSDKLSPVTELDGQNNVVSRFVYGISRTVPSYMVKNGVTYAFITDHVGSVRLVVNTSSGAIAQRLDYDSWGRVTLNSSPGFQPFGFAGGLYDEATGLVRFGARNYDAESGRWTTKDPIGFSGGANMYRYVGDDPVNVSDPTGLWPKYGVLYVAAQFSAGFGDFITSGFGLGEVLGLPSLTELARRAIDADDVVDRCSLWYTAGEMAGFAAGYLLGEAVSASRLAAEALEAEESIRFGKGANQVSHAFRHVEAAGLDQAAVESAIRADLTTAASEIVPGQAFNQTIRVAGQDITYTAYKLPNGEINVGRITVP